MVFETNTTYDYSFFSNQDSNVKPLPTTHNDVYYHRMQETANPNPNPVPNINMSNINRDKNGEAYFEFVYSPMLPKTTSKPIHKKEESIFYILKRCLCCG